MRPQVGRSRWAGFIQLTEIHFVAEQVSRSAPTVPGIMANEFSSRTPQACTGKCLMNCHPIDMVTRCQGSLHRARQSADSMHLRITVHVDRLDLWSLSV